MKAAKVVPGKRVIANDGTAYRVLHVDHKDDGTVLLTCVEVGALRGAGFLLGADEDVPVVPGRVPS